MSQCASERSRQRGKQRAATVDDGDSRSSASLDLARRFYERLGGMAIPCQARQADFVYTPS